MKSRLGDEDAVQLAECFLSRHKTLNSVYNPRERRVCSCIPVIQISGGRGRSEGQDHSWLHTEFQTSLGYIGYYVLKKIVCITRRLYKVDNCLSISFSILTIKGEEIISTVELLSASSSFTHQT